MATVSTYSKVDITSNALLLIGESPISSFTEDTTGALIASNLYEQTYEDLLTKHPWRFASAKASLSRLTSTPVDTWRYAFQLPANFLLVQHVDTGNTDYEIYQDKVYTNQSTLVLDYLFKPDESELPAYFVKLMEYTFASMFAIPVTDSATKAEYFQTLTKDQLTKSKTIDSQATPPVEFQHSPLTEIRA